MNNDNRIVEILSEMLVEHKAMREEQKAMYEEQKETNRRLATLEEQQKIKNVKQDAMLDELGRLRTALVRITEGTGINFVPVRRPRATH